MRRVQASKDIALGKEGKRPGQGTPWRDGERKQRNRGGPKCSCYRQMKKTCRSTFQRFDGLIQTMAGLAGGDGGSPPRSPQQRIGGIFMVLSAPATGVTSAARRSQPSNELWIAWQPGNLGGAAGGGLATIMWCAEALPSTLFAGAASVKCVDSIGSKAGCAAGSSLRAVAHQSNLAPTKRSSSVGYYRHSSFSNYFITQEQTRSAKRPSERVTMRPSGRTSNTGKVASPRRREPREPKGRPSITSSEYDRPGEKYTRRQQGQPASTGRGEYTETARLNPTALPEQRGDEQTFEDKRAHHDQRREGRRRGTEAEKGGDTGTGQCRDGSAEQHGDIAAARRTGRRASKRNEESGRGDTGARVEVKK
ncbi:hypothetical protein CMUS01_05074 [Colletotrichum musicola]|uniref:Uncharacterized protein n=1 Tax=Colletotrichum musicola TaxID=2175873 RepID=A0A8H6NKX8_9PEZI|nr:hypothetical protein CMUS01_05074 [Colletotrichum musicola]